MALSAEYYEWRGPECGSDGLLAEADAALEELRNGEAAEVFGDNFDFYGGPNVVSAHTYDQNRGQTLHLTNGGRWLVEHWSRWQDEREWYEYVTDEQAWEWLVENGENEATIARLFD